MKMKVIWRKMKLNNSRALLLSQAYPCRGSTFRIVIFGKAARKIYDTVQCKFITNDLIAKDYEVQWKDLRSLYLLKEHTKYNGKRLDSYILATSY